MKISLNNLDKNKKTIVVLAIVLSICLIIGGIYAFFSDITGNTVDIKSGNISLEIIQSTPFNGDIPDEGIDVNNTAVKIKSNSTIDIRLKLKTFPTVEYYNTTSNKWVVAPIPIQDVTLNASGTSWSGSATEFLYDQIVKPGESTTNLNITINNIAIPEELSNEQIRMRIKLIVEAGQSNYDMYQTIFEI